SRHGALLQTPLGTLAEPRIERDILDDFVSNHSGGMRGVVGALCQEWVNRAVDVSDSERELAVAKVERGTPHNGRYGALHHVIGRT
ncbi:MAG TPA: hypothetical protein VFP38_16350, partial [Bradyrhizobium sp.]|nr:hypothetical protein [Bradyrhizobium sp.]